MNFKALALLAVLAVVVVAYFAFFQNFNSKPSAASNSSEYHVHADFAVFINGQQLNFSQEKYMTLESCGKPGETEEHANVDLSTVAGMKQVVHLHDLNGNVIHVHNPNVTLPMFFKSIGFDLTASCFVDDQGTQYCNSGDKTLKVFVNGVQKQDFVDYKPQDLDKVLVTFGSETRDLINAQYATITNQACIYSQKCPTPPGFVLTQESCTS